jgi:hypothetical protein
MKQKMALKVPPNIQNLQKQINGKFNNIGSSDENKKISLQQFLPLSPSSSLSQSSIFSCMVSVSAAALNTV